MAFGFDWRLRHWSEWLLAVGLILFASWLASYCYACHLQIVRNGGYQYAISGFVNGD